MRATADGSFELDPDACSASYVEWRPAPDFLPDLHEYGDDDPTWVTSFCVLDTGHAVAHLDAEGHTFEDGEERGGVASVPDPS